MYKHKCSKETIWAVSVILVCILAGCFLLIKITVKKSCTNKLSVGSEAIILQKSVTKPIDSADSSSDIMVDESASTESLELLIEISDATPTIEATSVIQETNYQSPIDFESLWEINKDVYAWITIPGTIIDYPILQNATDNSYYLNYNMDGTEGFPGCIYTENINSKDFTDNNTVIYGHNLRNGKMFTDLHKFRDTEFFAKNDTIYIYTPEKLLTYKIFAAYLYDDRHLMNSFDFSNREIYAQYLSEIQAMESEDVNIRKDIKITNRDKIITLITCIREQPEKRVYVQAVLETFE